MKQYKNNTGYMSVRLKINGVGVHYSVHRLVALAFLENPNNYKEVNHKDENPLNNELSNLEWCDHNYNMNYGTRVKRTANKLSKKVYQYNKDLRLIKIWNSTNECNKGGYCQANVQKCCTGKIKQAYKYIWSYEPLE